MNILITGGSGFIGSHLVKKLIDFNHSISVITRPSSNLFRLKSIQNIINIYRVKNDTQLERVFKKTNFDVVIHLATFYMKYIDNTKNMMEMNHANIDFPTKILLNCIKYNVKAFINTGSFFEYKMAKKPIAEDREIEPFNYYTVTKICFENILKYFACKNMLKAATLKLFYVYGEDDNPKVVSLIIDAIQKNKKLELTYGKQKLCFTHVEDVTNAYIKTIKYLFSKNYKKYQNFNISTNKTCSLRQMVEIVEKIADKKSKINFSKPYPPNEIRYASCNYAKAKRVLGWQPEIDIVKGLRRIYNYQSK